MREKYARSLTIGVGILLETFRPLFMVSFQMRIMSECDRPKVDLL